MRLLLGKKCVDTIVLGGLFKHGMGWGRHAFHWCFPSLSPQGRRDFAILVRLNPTKNATKILLLILPESRRISQRLVRFRQQFPNR